MTDRFRLAETTDTAAIVALVESAYRGDASRVGWTTEADFLEGQRIDPEGVLADIGKANSVILLAESEGVLQACCHLEKTGKAYASQTTGKMHACGHDGHTVMLLAAAEYLAETRDFDGTVHFIFQPAEEGEAGAKAMMDDGLFEQFPVDGVFGLHNWPSLEPGQFMVRPGPMMAAADRITVEITGKGGHGAHPYQTVDPVLVAAHIITAVQSIVSRNVKPVDSAVISLCAMQAGDLGAMSVIPDKATLVGTVRITASVSAASRFSTSSSGPMMRNWIGASMGGPFWKIFTTYCASGAAANLARS